MHVASLATVAGPAAILEAFHAYRGSVIDLDHARVIGPASLARGQAALMAAAALQGLDSGDRVVMAAGNGPLFITLLAAILEAGGSPLLLHAKTPPAELRRTALKFGAQWIACDGWDSADMQSAGLSATRICDTSWLRTCWSRVDERDAAFDTAYRPLPGVPLHPTSGTTGVPKVAVRPGPCAVAEAVHYIDAIGVESSDVILASSPMSHAYAYGMCVMVPLLSGANVVTARQFEAACVRRTLGEHGITILPAVPAMLDVLLFGAGEQLRDTPRCVLSAGAPLSERTARRFWQYTGRHVRPLFGTTETGGITVAADDGRMPEGGYVGRTMRGVEAMVRQRNDDPATDSSATQGVAPLAIRSSSMMAGYLSHEGVDSSWIEDGWFLTGDLASIDDDGAISLKGRASEVINVGGLKVIPYEVEEVIASLAGIGEVKVYAGRDRKGREFVKAAVAIAGQVDEKAIREHCARELVYYKRPRAVVFVERLPRTASGKVVLRDLP